jgi:hypothetical protein
MRRSALGLLLLFQGFVFFSLQAQTASTLRCEWITVNFNKAYLVSGLVIPSTIQINQAPEFSFESSTGALVFAQPPGVDSLYVCYRIAQSDIRRPYEARNQDALDSQNNYNERISARRSLPPTAREELFSSPGIQKTGTISRGVSVGNNQSVFVNSVLNLQLEGQLTEDISLLAVISDQNIPYQPEGNTQQIQQFDQVFVQLKGRHSSLTAGDVVFQNRSSYFLKYYRNVQGVQFRNVHQDSLHYRETVGGYSIAKGKFHSKEFGPGQSDSLREGVLGPYRLTGPNGERFIIVLANSEEVFLDGRKLKRGFDYDYVIDYNNAEITFTPTISISKFSRLRVNFEFSDQNYSRRIFEASHHQGNSKSRIFANIYSERDNPRRPLLLDISNEDKVYLSTIGDDLNNAFLDGVDSVGYAESETRYKKRIVGGEVFYVFSTDPDSALYQVSFTRVALGAGTYNILDTTLNARVYVYVGSGFGEYLPFVVVPTPKQREMYTAGFALQGQRTEWLNEFALSREDQNLYSDIDDGDNIGYSLRSGYKLMPKKGMSDSVWSWVAETSVEFNDERFRFIDRIRETDFERNWNESSSTFRNNLILNGAIGMLQNTANFWQYRLTYRRKEGELSGFQQQVNFNKTLKAWIINGDATWIESKGTGQTQWWRGKGQAAYRSKFIVPGARAAMDRNAVRDSLGQLSSSLNDITEYGFFIGSPEAAAFRYLLDIGERQDREVFNNEWGSNARTRTFTGSGGRSYADGRSWNVSANYRLLNANRGPTPTPDEETMNTRVDWNTQTKDRSLRSQITLSGGAGRELQRQYIYQAVPSGQGNYIWNDFNKDGQQDLNEFVEKIFPDTVEYIRLFVPTDDYVTAFSNALNWRVDWNAPRAWKKSGKGLVKWLAKWSNNSSWSTSKKTTAETFADRFIPFYQNIPDQNLISLQRSLRTTFFFNRSHPTFGAELGYFNNQGKQFLTQGFETRELDDWNAAARYNINQMWNIRLQGGFGARRAESDFLAGRNYQLNGIRAGPELSWQPRNSLRLTAAAQGLRKQNVYPGSVGENSQSWEQSLEWKWNVLSRRNFSVKARVVSIKANLNGTDPNSAIAYELFEALQPGTNLVWNANWQERLANGLQLQFQYEGRKSEGTKAIHTGRMQVNLLF